MRKILIIIASLLIGSVVYADDCNCLNDFNMKLYVNNPDYSIITPGDILNEYMNNIKKMKCVIQETKKLNKELEKVIEKNKNKKDIFRPKYYPFDNNSAYKYIYTIAPYYF